MQMFCRWSYFSQLHSHLGFFPSIFLEYLWNNLFISYISLVIPRSEIQNMKIKLPIKDNKFESINLLGGSGCCAVNCVCVCVCDCFVNGGQYLFIFFKISASFENLGFSVTALFYLAWCYWFLRFHFKQYKIGHPCLGLVFHNSAISVSQVCRFNKLSWPPTVSNYYSLHDLN